jgi:hypothetical protein
MSSVFRGFKSLKYPVFTVITPQTGLQFDVRGLNVSEVDKLKHSMVTPSKATEILNRTIWESLDGKPEHITKYEDFLKNVTTVDREALVYASYVTTFGDKRDLVIECRNPRCAKSDKTTVLLSKMFNIVPYPNSSSFKTSYKMASSIDKTNNDPSLDNIINREEMVVNNTKKNKVKFVEEPKSEDIESVNKNEKEIEEPVIEDIISKRIEIQLPSSDQIYIILKQPTLYDLERMNRTLPFNKTEEIAIASEILMIDRIEERYNTSKQIDMVLDAPEVIIEAYNTLPAGDRQIIYTTFNEEFGKYGMSLKSDWVCKNCGEKDTIEVDITSYFFRMVMQS